ncbi:hypothetical protein FNCP11_18220 [Fusobacterium nucleatum]|nr:hypothetical protein [Fusobacterium nucleatum]BEO99506.1 hypothetical protein FNCP11_18220 [Fusobacterium nucleatum]BEP10907.1 hypothetical protein FNSP11_17510 [Fusobacterium nucleatum]
MIIINNIFMIVILYSILIFLDKISEKKELNKNEKIKTVIAVLLIINFFCLLVDYGFLYFINSILILIIIILIIKSLILLISRKDTFYFGFILLNILLLIIYFFLLFMGLMIMSGF